MRLSVRSLFYVFFFILHLIINEFFFNYLQLNKLSNSYFFYFGAVSIQLLEKNSDSVLNEFGSVLFEKNAVRFVYRSYLLLM